MKVKRKGAYQYEDLGWHQNQGGLVIPRAAEAYMVHGKDIEEFVKEHFKKDRYDFLLRTKAPRAHRLYLEFDDGRREQQQNTCRYYVTSDPAAGKMIKWMPPLASKPDEDRENSIEAGYRVKVCNNIVDYGDDIDYSYYVAEAKKLLVPPVVDVSELNSESEDCDD